MKIKVVYLLISLMILTIFLIGCTENSSGKTGSQDSNPVMNATGTSTGQKLQTDKSNTVDNSDSGLKDSKTSNTFFNIRIVPVSELEKLQKEMSSDEYLVKNDDNTIIGIVSSKGLTIRGDLVQLERNSGNAGKEFDKEDVMLHLLDITFGLDNAKIKLFKADKKYKFWLDGHYTDSEVKFVKNLSILFNSLSGTTQFEDEEVTLGFLQTNYDVIPNNFYNIKIITDKMLQQYYDDKKKDSDHLIKNSNGELIGIVNDEYIYLLNTLSEEDQQYYILKGLLYSMGLHGVSYKNTESFFYRNEGMNRELSDLDKEAIKLLYGGSLKTGNTLEDAKKTFGLET
ncbi:MAG: hypothetical protein LUQ50_09070 [Methanospirillum sp.]|uniref:hypothetical protein n=1 Tax=Methanospirillum sp. TaxID=45200 RepID=UPI0023726777|nr:hypothetical protein [Methanospirillum sp.]MDD1729209.1 hypothetical protein [Methanospirillum sp.]